ncbi:MAG: site-2 protease family protein [Phycisphaerales bacterium]|nr:site-2 protease family protein [Phycisphaerales bacterium]
MRQRDFAWLRLLLMLLLMLPLAVLFLMPGTGMVLGTMWFWLALMLCLWMVWMVLGVPCDESAPVASVSAGPRALATDELPPVVRRVMDVRLATEHNGVLAFHGPLKEPADQAYEDLKREAGAQTVPLVQEDEQLGAAVVLVPKNVEQATMERPVRPWVNWLLFALTVVTTTWAGAAHQGVDLLREPARFAVGLPYALGLLAILGVHELGHYFTAKYHGIRVTPPYFIPVPLALGTFGAFIQMRSPVENRRALFDVAVAGPLAGLAVAIPALLVGLRLSQIAPVGTPIESHMMGGTSVGSSILFAVLAKLSLGDALQYGHILRLHPLAFAGWLGLFVTALNLLPIGQLDGGHIARAMFGNRVGRTISTVAMWTLILLALFVWPGLFMWAIIIFFIAGRSMPPLNDVTPITSGRRWLGYAAFLILLLIISPLPHTFWDRMGIHCPYL